MRSHGEEAVFPRPPRLRHPDFRHAGMRLPLRVLPELAHEPGAARRRGRCRPDRRYRELGGVLQHVLDAIRMVYERGFWLELVTLVVPGFNDDDAQLRRAADYIASVSPEIPWHVTAFHKDYRMTDPDNTSADTLVRACEIGAAAGLKFVYAGNLPGRVGRWEHTWCPDCGELLIERHGYVIQQQRIGVGGDCVACGRRIPGVWS